MTNSKLSLRHPDTQPDDKAEDYLINRLDPSRFIVLFCAMEMCYGMQSSRETEVNKNKSPELVINVVSIND